MADPQDHTTTRERTLHSPESPLDCSPLSPPVIIELFYPVWLEYGLLLGKKRRHEAWGTLGETVGAGKEWKNKCPPPPPPRHVLHRRIQKKYGLQGRKEETKGYMIHTLPRVCLEQSQAMPTAPLQLLKVPFVISPVCHSFND